MAESAKPDRRVERTRRALTAAFNALVLARGYDAVTVRDVIERADVGRSTFYEHYESKDDMLRNSMRPLLVVLAAAVGDTARVADVEAVIAHFAGNRRLARMILDGPARPIVARLLAELIDDALTAARRSRAALPAVPLPLIAAQLAGAQLGLIEAWLAPQPPCSARALAQALIASTQGASAALFAPRNARASAPRRT